jgi:hypothetical protein
MREGRLQRLVPFLPAKSGKPKKIGLSLVRWKIWTQAVLMSWNGTSGLSLFVT